MSPTVVCLGMRTRQAGGEAKYLDRILAHRRQWRKHETVAKETGMTPAAIYLAKGRVLAKLREAVADVEEE